MLNSEELPFDAGCEAAFYHETSPSLIWQMLSNQRFWFYAAAITGASVIFIHFGLAAVSAASLSVVLHTWQNLHLSTQEKTSFTMSMIGISAVLSSFGYFFQSKHNIDVADESDYYSNVL